MSMPSGVAMQRQLAGMLQRGCTHAVIECTSEGLAQNRHLGIGFDVAVITNLSAAHLDSHGSFDGYRAAKGKLFARAKILGVNFDDEAAVLFEVQGW